MLKTNIYFFIIVMVISKWREEGWYGGFYMYRVVVMGAGSGSLCRAVGNGFFSLRMLDSSWDFFLYLLLLGSGLCWCWRPGAFCI